MSWTLATASHAIVTAGTRVNATIVADTTTLAQWADEAEALCCDSARYDLVTNYAQLTTEGKAILSSIVCAHVAQKIINYEPEAIGITGAKLRLNFLQGTIYDGLSKISEDKIKTYLQISS